MVSTSPIYLRLLFTLMNLKILKKCILKTLLVSFILFFLFVHQYTYTISVRDLWVTKLNNHQVNRYIGNIDKIFSSTLINSITINGNVVLNKITNISKINNIKFEELLNNVSIIAIPKPANTFK